MRSFLAALTRLVLPYGATSGQRLIIDGAAGVITGYDEFNDQTFELAPAHFEINAGSQLVMDGTEYQFVADGFVFQAYGNVPTISGQWSLDVGSATEGPSLELSDLATTKRATIEMVPTTGQFVTDQFLRYGTTSPATPNPWQNVTLLNGWANRGAGFDPLQYRLLPDGTCHLRGTIAGGASASGTQIGSIAAGYRPATKDTVVPIASDNGPAAYSAANASCRLQIQSGGNMFIYGTGPGPLWIDTRWTTLA